MLDCNVFLANIAQVYYGFVYGLASIVRHFRNVCLILYFSICYWGAMHPICLIPMCPMWCFVRPVEY